MEDSVENEILELLNKALIKLKDVKEPTVDYDYWDYVDGGNGLVLFDDESENNKLVSLKVCLTGMVESFNKKGYNDMTKKMARAYYTSFCNG